MLLKRAILFFAALFLTQAVMAAEWYEGGTLHKANALEWQQATEANKLATVSDFLANAYKGGLLTDRATAVLTEAGLPAFKQISEALVKEVNAVLALEKQNPKNNEFVAKQDIASLVAVAMSLSGIVKK